MTLRRVLLGLLVVELTAFPSAPFGAGGRSSAASAAGRAPAIESSTWLNTPDGKAPTIAERPVLVEFWTFG